MKFLFQILALTALLSHNNHQRIVTDAQTIPEVIQAEPTLSTFYTGLDRAFLISVLSTEGPYTVFAANDEAFSVVDPKYLEPEWRAHLTEIMLQHVVEGPPFETQFWEVGIELLPLSGSTLAVTALDPYQINTDVTVITPDVTADNGIVHIVDTVILPPSAQDSIMDIIIVIPDFFSTLMELLVQTGLDALLADADGGPYTLFAPSNEAFAAMNPDELTALQADTAALTELLEYHISPGIRLVETLSQDNVTELPTLQGTPLPKPLDAIQFVDLLATNGAMHIVNEVLIPPGGVFSLKDTETPVETTPTDPTPTDIPLEATVAPDETTESPQENTTAPEGTAAPVVIGQYDDFAWAELPEDVRAAAEVLGYDEPSWDNGSNVFSENLAWDDLTPEQQEAAMVFGYDQESWDATEAPTEEPTATEAPAFNGTIAEIAIASNFTLMVTALNMTGWLVELDGPGSSGEGFTVFAVPDEGFDKLPAKFIEDPQWNSHLTNVIAYHILPQVVLAVNLTVNTTLDTLNTNSVEVNSDDPLQINEVNVTETDILADNGVIHVLEEVLLPPSATDTALDLIVNFEQFSILSNLVNITGLSDFFDGPGPMTLFAPIDDAFNALPEGTLDSLAADPDTLRDILLYHVTPQLFEYVNLNADESLSLTTEQSGNVTLSYDEGAPQVNDAAVLFQDLLVQNGIIQVIGGVLIPPTDIPETTAPSAAPVEATGAPTVTATVVETTDSPTVAPDNLETGSPTSMATAPPVAGTLAPTTRPSTLLDIVSNGPAFTTLYGLVIEAGLDDLLSAPSPQTFFAPNNDAFDALAEGLLDSLVAKPDNLRNLLLYHIIPGDVLLYAELTASDGSQYTSVQGANLTITLDENNQVLVDQASIIVQDLEASNGVLHMIDAVLIPAAETAPPIPLTTIPPSQAPVAVTAAPTQAPVAGTAAPTQAPVAGTASPTQATVEIPVVTPAPTGQSSEATPSPTVDNKCVTIPGQQVCCPPGETEGVFFFCRYL